MWIDDWENIDVFSYEDLKKYVDSWFDNMTDDEHYIWCKSPDPPFEMWVLGQIKEGDKVEINFTNKSFKVL